MALKLALLSGQTAHKFDIKFYKNFASKIKDYPLNLTKEQEDSLNQINKYNQKFNVHVLQGVTGSGKTFTMAKVIEATNRPALILAPNKTLAAQLYGEMKTFFPDNAVEYFVSYYDYYTPEAYVPRSDTYLSLIHI